MEAVKIASDGSIQLPKTVLRRFPRRSELAVWTEGDVIVLKRLKPAKLSAIAARRPEKEMPLAEIDTELQGHRKKSARASREPPRLVLDTNRRRPRARCRSGVAAQ